MKQIIFDCDGVIVDSEIEAAKALVKEFKSLDIQITLDYHLQHHSGRTFKNIFQDLLERNIIPSDLDIATTIRRIEENSYANIKPIPNILSALQDISLPKAVVSNGAMHQIRFALNVAKVSAFFNENIFSATMANQPKPSPDIYQLAAKKLQVNPEDCLVVEDSFAGVTAAVAAGMTVLSFIGASHILDGHREKVLDAGAIDTFSEMAKLPALIKKMVKI